MLKQELDQYTNKIKKSTDHLHWTTSKTTSQILISQIVWQDKVCLKIGKEWKTKQFVHLNKERRLSKKK